MSIVFDGTGLPVGSVAEKTTTARLAPAASPSAAAASPVATVAPPVIQASQQYQSASPVSHAAFEEWFDLAYPPKPHASVPVSDYSSFGFCMCSNLISNRLRSSTSSPSCNTSSLRRSSSSSSSSTSLTRQFTNRNPRTSLRSNRCTSLLRPRSTNSRSWFVVRIS